MSINNLYTERAPSKVNETQYTDQVRQSMTWRSMSQIYFEYADQGPMAYKGPFVSYLVQQMPNIGTYLSETYPNTDLTKSSITEVFSYVQQYIIDTEIN